MRLTRGLQEAETLLLNIGHTDLLVPRPSTEAAGRNCWCSSLPGPAQCTPQPTQASYASPAPHPGNNHHHTYQRDGEPAQKYSSSPPRLVLPPPSQPRQRQPSHAQGEGVQLRTAALARGPRPHPSSRQSRNLHLSREKFISLGLLLWALRDQSNTPPTGQELSLSLREAPASRTKLHL